MSLRIPTRLVPRATRVARTTKSASRRFQSTASSTTQAAANVAPNGSSHFAAGVAGGVAGAGILYGIYTMTPSGKVMKTMNTTIKETNKKYEQLAASLKNQTPSTDEALGKVKEVCYSYASWVPGGRQYVDVAFKDIEDIREANRDEVDKLVSETYKEFQNITAAGLSVEAASRAWEALQRLSQRIASLSANASEQLLDNHPQVKEKFGSSFEALKQMGSQYGPEAKKVVDDTWKQVNDIIKGGFTAENADKVRKLVEEKTQQVRKLGDQVWEKGMEKAKPYLDKSPAARDLINNNKDVLKQGNASELFSKLKSLSESGDSKKLEQYVQETVEKAQQSGDKSWTSSLAGGGAGFSVLGQFLGSSSEGVTQKVKDNIGVLSEVYKKHSDEGQKLLEETKEDLRKLLEEKAKKAQKIADTAAKGQ